MDLRTCRDDFLSCNIYYLAHYIPGIICKCWDYEYLINYHIVNYSIHIIIYASGLFDDC